MKTAENSQKADQRLPSQYAIGKEAVVEAVEAARSGRSMWYASRDSFVIFLVLTFRVRFYEIRAFCSDRRNGLKINHSYSLWAISKYRSR